MARNITQMRCPHKRRIERHDHQRFGFGRFDQAFDHMDRRVKEFPNTVGACAQSSGLRIGAEDGRALLILDFDEIHTGEAEEFQMFVNRRLTLVVGAIEMQEESRRNMFGGALLHVSS